jgi:tetratricopeptide (TPR) repeat protein
MAIDNFMKIKNEFRAAKRTGDTGRIIFRKVLAHEKFLKNSEKEKLLELSEIKFKESIKKLIQVNRNDEVLIILYDLIEFYKFIGNYEKALLNAEKAKEIGDSLRTLDVNKKIASFNTTQDLKFQEKENQVIIIKQNYEGLIYNLVLVFVIVLIFLLAIIYFQHKRNQVYVNNKIKSHK